MVATAMGFVNAQGATTMNLRGRKFRIRSKDTVACDTVVHFLFRTIHSIEFNGTNM
jgi:hypothetical protein